MGKQKTGKGVAALTEVLGGLKMDPKNVRRRERAAELRVARGAAAKAMTMDMRDDSIPDYPDGVAKLGARQVRVTFTGTMKPTDEGAAALRQAIDEPAPVRLSVVTLAHTFTEACAALAEAERVFDQAVAARAKAKLALDAEISRMANEVG